mmetsp:Transcript_12962/g.26297  ORF Transcript_12962/g.26297 Transcript_12962/m.26297 type:complete len:80 (+) Transcript_12962:1859-2098(+)
MRVDQSEERGEIPDPIVSHDFVSILIYLIPHQALGIPSPFSKRFHCHYNDVLSAVLALSGLETSSRHSGSSLNWIIHSH